VNVIRLPFQIHYHRRSGYSISDAGVGKSTLLQRFTDNTYNEMHEPTIGIEFVIKTVEINGTRIRLQVWDTAGQDEFLSLARSYYRASAGVLLVYDITKRKSFNDIKKWLDEARFNGHSKMSYILIGNKNDLQSE
jgi:small GTP-binding protein